jgi:hypothetical protein
MPPCAISSAAAPSPPASRSDASTHSLRSGFVIEAGKQGISLAETMTLSGHKGVQTAWATTTLAKWLKRGPRT